MFLQSLETFFKKTLEKEELNMSSVFTGNNNRS